MGCDIHSAIEFRTKAGKWEVYGGVSRGVDPDGYSWIRPLEEGPGRNYDLFAVLADVRNGRGFAGHYTCDRITPIASPRGLPSDVSEDFKSISDHWVPDGHSHSWVSLEELSNYGWSTPKVVDGGTVGSIGDSCDDAFCLMNKMRGIEAALGPGSSRFVFFFDN